MYNENPKCPGGPHLKQTYDDYFEKWVNKLCPSYGFEVFCNMEGQYTFFVATVVPSIDISICAIAVFGTRYVRDVQLTSSIMLKAGD